MIVRDEKRINEGYEIQMYNQKGQYACVVRCDTLEEVSSVLINYCNGRVSGNFPTVHQNGYLMA